MQKLYRVIIVQFQFIKIKKHKIYEQSHKIQVYNINQHNAAKKRNCNIKMKKLKYTCENYLFN